VPPAGRPCPRRGVRAPGGASAILAAGALLLPTFAKSYYGTMSTFTGTGILPEL